MADREDRMCVLLPAGAGHNWAVPQRCLAEVVTLQGGDATPPGSINWRGLDIPVLDFGSEGAEPWRDSRTGAGLVAVMLGLAGQGQDYWALAIRGEGLSVRKVQAQDCEDRPEEQLDYALAAFALGDVTYQVPDLPALQQRAQDVAA